MRRRLHYFVRQNHGADTAHDRNTEDKGGTVIHHGIFDHFHSIRDQRHTDHGERSVDDRRGKRGDHSHELRAEPEHHKDRSSCYDNAAGCDFGDSDQSRIRRIARHGGTAEQRSGQASQTLSDGASVNSFVFHGFAGDGLNREPSAGGVKQHEQVDHRHEETCLEVELRRSEMQRLREREPCGGSHRAEVSAAESPRGDRSDHQSYDHREHVKDSAVLELVLQDHA